MSYKAALMTNEPKNRALASTGYFILLLLVVYADNCQAQKESFYDNVFKKEFSELNKEYSNLKKDLPNNNGNNIEFQIYTPPEILPQWLINPPVGEQNVYYAIGISDPWINSARGREQAKERALSIVSLMCKIHTKGVIETYSNNLDAKFQQISQFNTVPPVILKCEPIDSSETKYREQIFLFKVTASEEAKENRTAIEYFISSDNKEEKCNQFEKLKLISNLSNTKSEYESIEINGIKQIKSIQDLDTIKIQPSTYRYTLSENTMKDELEAGSCLLTGGLWQGYLKSLFLLQHNTAYDISPKMKSLSDNKESEEQNNSLKHLIRTIYDVQFSFSITAICVRSNEIEMHLKPWNFAD